MPPRAPHPARIAALAVLAMLACPGCGEDDVVKPDPDATSSLEGFFASEGNAGRIRLVISAPTRLLAPAPNAGDGRVSATAALAPEIGNDVSLAGTYDTALDSLHLLGSGYEFGGRVAWRNGIPTLAGTFTSPGDDGAFGAALVSSFGPHVYCGDLFMASDSLVGRLGYVVFGVGVLGAACFSGEPEPVALEGDVDQTSAKPRLTMAGMSAARDLTLHGAYDAAADVAAGSWASTGSAGDASGTWSAQPCP